MGCRVLLLALLATPLDSFYHPVCTRVPLALRAQQQRQQRPPLGVRYPKADFAAAARGMGCEAWTVGAQDPLEFALAEAFETHGPTLVDVTVDPSGYRDQLTALRG